MLLIEHEAKHAHFDTTKSRPKKTWETRIQKVSAKILAPTKNKKAQKLFDFFNQFFFVIFLFFFARN